MVRTIPASGQWPGRETFRERLPLAVAVLLLHLAVLSIFEIRYNITGPGQAPEAFITFPNSQIRTAPAADTNPAAPAARNSFGTFNPPREWTEPKQDLSALHLAITGCAPENFTKLSAQDRARCQAMGLASVSKSGASDDFSGESGAVHADIWAAEIKERNTPPRIPCTYISSAPMIDPICAAELLLKSLK